MTGPYKRLRRIKHKRRIFTGKPVHTDLPKLGDSNAPILFVLDPIITNNDSKVTSPITKGNMKFLANSFAGTGIKGKNIFFVSCSAPCDMETWQRDRLLGEHLKKDRGKLLSVIEQLKPKLIITAGKSATRQVYGRAVKITQCRGLPVYDNVLKVPVLPILGLYHVTSRPEMQNLFNADIETVSSIVRHKYDITKLADDQKNDYRWLFDLSKLLKNPPKRLSVDCEGIGLRWYKKETVLLTVQLCDKAGRAWSVPIDYPDYQNVPGLRDTPKKRAKRIAQLKELLENPKVKCSGQNFKFDVLLLLAKADIKVANYEDDTMLLQHMLDENMLSKSLSDITRVHVPAMAGYSDEFDRDPIHEGKTRMDKVPPRKMLVYGCGDTDAVYRARRVLRRQIEADSKLFNCYKRVVMPAIRAFCDVEQEGYPINRKKLKQFERFLKKHQRKEGKKLFKRIHPDILDEYRDTGVGLKLTRDALMRAVLFTHRKGFRLTPTVFTKGGEPSVSTKTHLPYFQPHSFVDDLILFIKNDKLLNTYVKGFYKYIHNGRIRPSYALHRTVTGRSASLDPNGQNFPKRGALAKKYREIFEAPEGWVFLEADYSQIELRLAAIMANEPTMLRVYRQGGDIHCATAANVMGIPLREFMALKNSDPDTFHFKRFQAKAVNFGFIYGMWWIKFMAYAKTDYGIDYTEEEARTIREMFFRGFGNLTPWHWSVRDIVRKQGYIRTIDGRIRHLPMVHSNDEGISKQAERQAINSPVQAFGSDLGLMALARMQKHVDKSFLRPLGFVHDAIVCLVRKDKAMEAARFVRGYMESNPLEKWFGFVSPIPMPAEVSLGETLAYMEEVPGDILNDTNVVSHKTFKKEMRRRKLARKIQECAERGVRLPKIVRKRLAA